MSDVIRARWILPIDRPSIRDGWVEISGGRIVALGDGRPPGEARDLGEVAVMPRLVNAHTHLELSWMAGLVPPAGSMVEWIRRLIAVRKAGPPGGQAAAKRAARAAAETLSRTGTSLVGEVTNELGTPAAMRTAGLGGVAFHELVAFNTADAAEEVRDAWERVAVARAASSAAPLPLEYGVVAHAPYSVSPELFIEIARRAGNQPLSVHLAESPEELEFLHTGRGPFRQLLEDLDVWTGHWPVPCCEPVTYIARLGYLRAGLLVVHGVYLSDDELERLRDVGAVVVTCPRSNEWVGAGPPRLSRMYAAGVPVAVGTDSLASAGSLNLFDELSEMRRIAPDVTAACLLESATRVGAEALGFGSEFGTLSRGKRALFTLVDVPAGVRDVEEYLLSGLPAERVRLAA